MADFSEVTVALLFTSTAFYSGCEIMTEDKCNNFLHLDVKVVKTILGFRSHMGDVRMKSSEDVYSIQCTGSR